MRPDDTSGMGPVGTNNQLGPIGTDVLHDIVENGACSMYWGASNLLRIAQDLVRSREKVFKLQTAIGRITSAVLDVPHE